MNDINILTFWGVPNYGTFAQAYALQASIQKAYPEYDVKQINYLCPKRVVKDFLIKFTKKLQKKCQEALSCS